MVAGLLAYCIKAIDYRLVGEGRGWSHLLRTPNARPGHTVS